MTAMSVRITEIAVSTLGPLEKGVSFKPGMFNLVFGKNEKGKTCLVEFLIKSLFRNSKDWGLRDFNGAGRVTVDGLDGKAQPFSPSSKKKIEDFLDAADAGLPPDFSRLLVVKGAEADLSKSGADKPSIARFLSGIGLLDRILNSKAIPKTLLSARIENGIILGQDKGVISDRNEIGKKLTWLDTLFDQIDKGYSDGQRQKLAEESKAIRTEIETLLKAKRHLAYRINRDMKALEKEKSGIDEILMKDLGRKVFEHQQKSNDLRKWRIKQAEEEKEGKSYEWLKSACEQYRGFSGVQHRVTRSVWPATALMLLIVSAVLVLTGRPLWALMPMAVMTVCGLLYWLHVQSSMRSAVQSRESDALRQEFKKRFGDSFSSQADLDAMLKKIEPHYYQNANLQKQIAEVEKYLESLESAIEAGFKKLTRKSVESDSWGHVLEGTEAKVKLLTDEIQKQRVELSRLNIREDHYEPADPGADFDEKNEKDLKDKLVGIESELKDMQNRLHDLKQRISNETGDPFSISWPELICNLKTKREEVFKRYRDLTAEILGKIAVVKVAESIRKDENAKIEAGLNAPAVRDMLKSMTGRYDRLSLDGEALKVGDAYQEFDFKDLSTGAREQVLLALRIGFASMLSKRGRLFLMLDDAFQYSDWERRQGLVEAAAGMARQGWQVFYFTMDDHLRGLFDAKGKEFGKDYVRVEL